MARFLLNTVIAALAVVSVTAQMIRPEIIIKTIAITIDPNNPYFGEGWDATPQPGGQIISVNMPVLKDLPEDTMMYVKIELSGQVVLEFETTVCDALDDEVFGKPVLKYAEPKGEFPEECPFTKGESFRINNYKIPNDKLPQNIQPGAVHAEAKIYTKSVDTPELFWVADGEIIFR